MNILWKCINLQAIQDVDEFVFFIRTDTEKFNITLFAPMEPLQWMGAVRIRVQTADKTSQ